MHDFRHGVRDGWRRTQVSERAITGAAITGAVIAAVALVIARLA